MRPATLVLAALLVALVLVPSATSLALPPVSVCLPACDVPSRETAGFLPPVTFVLSGSSVTWTAVEAPHTATDETDLCFHAYFRVGDPGTARFEVVEGALYAANAGDDLRRCTAATPLPDGSLSLAYTCVYHPNTMNGILVVK